MEDASDPPYLVAALDLGSTHSSYAFSYRHDYLKDPLNISTTVWPGNMDLYTPKTPTVILLDKNLEFVAFGYEAQDVFADKATDKEHEEYRLFQNFTLPFCNPDVEIGDDWTILDTHGIEAPAVKVISEVLQFYQKHLQSTIAKHTGHEETHQVRWVIVIPATWNESARNLLLTAAGLAGFDGDHTFIADASEMVLVHNKHIKPSNNLMTRGNRIMTVDLGGGGVEMCVYDISNDREIEIAHKQYHASLGSRLLNDLLIVFLAELFNVDFENFRSALRTNHLDNLELLRNFEAVKRFVGDGGTKPITLKLPISFQEHIDQVSGLSMKNALSSQSSELQTSVALVKGSVRMDRRMLKLLFIDLIHQIINTVAKLDEYFTENNIKITHIILTGGFSECKLLQNEIKKRHNKAQTPTDSGISALKGAVIYGHDLESILCLNSTENSVYSLKEFRQIAGSGDQILNETENAISSFQARLQSGLKTLQEEYEKEYHMMCGTEPNDLMSENGSEKGIETDSGKINETGTVDMQSEYDDASRIVDEELQRQEEEEREKQETAQREREAALEQLMIIEQQRQRQLEELQRQREAEEQRKKELEQKQRELEAQRQRELEAQRQQEKELQKKEEAERERLRAIEHQRGLAAAAEKRRLEKLEKKPKKSSICNIL